ncbi:RNA polymerase sigma factor RpoD/SigA [candidate division KSB1 bacterium]
MSLKQKENCAEKLNPKDEQEPTSLNKKRPLTSKEQKMVADNMGLVGYIAKRYLNFGLDYEDLIQEGAIGLSRAVQKFDESRGFKLSTYAHWWIRQAISRAITNQAKPIRIPINAQRAIRKLHRAQEKLVQELGREPTIQESAIATGLPEEKVQNLMQVVLLKNSVSLDAPKYKESGVETFVDSVKDDKTLISDQAITAKNERKNLRVALKYLSPRDEYIVQKYFGMDPEEYDESATLEDIGEEFELSRERVRQIKVEALKKLERLLSPELGVMDAIAA